MLHRRHLLHSGAAAALALGGCGRTRGVPLWFSYGGKNREALLALVARFNREQPEHALEAVYQGDYFELLAKLRTAIHAGRAPAVTHVVGEILPYLVDAGVLEPLAEQPGLSQDLGFLPALEQRGAFAAEDKPLYALPFNRSTPIAYLNGDVLDELGLSPPTTWEELTAFAVAATRGEDDDKRYGFSCPIDWWFWVALTYQAGGEIAEGGTFTLGGEAGEQALAFFQRLVSELKVMRPPSGRDYNAWQVQNADFVSGRVAMIWNSTAFVRYLEQTAKFRVVCAPLPRNVRHGVPTGGTLFVMPRGSPDPWRRAAAAFLAFMAEPRNSNEFATKTGYIPVTREGVRLLEADGYYERVPNDRVAVAQLQSARPWPWSRELFRVQREVIQARLEACVLERTSPKAALDAARAAIAEGP